ncbi:MAG: alanyl-tRNA editing protein [Acidobacteria bacterium]|nr:MAG: alanyl-tRNA editing protein [Acidobacteriota bacterium]
MVQTERLYYTDSYLREFRAHIAGRSPDGRLIYLDRSAFYPASGGQPHDTGWIAGVPVIEVIDDADGVAHRAESTIEGTEVECRIDWSRRFDHMQQHSGQHLLSAVFIEQFGIETVSFHLGQESSTLDLETASVDTGKVLGAERRANEVVTENRPLEVSFEDAAAARDLRKPSERGGTLRIVSIPGLDRSACGGTHVRATGEIGPILIRKLEKIRNTVRVEFLCGIRAVRRARADYDTLARIAQSFSASLEDTPQLVSAQLEAAREGDKTRRKLEAELAGYQGRALYEAAAPDANGTRRVLRRVPKGTLEGLRALAQSFASGSKAVFVGAVEQPPSMLLATSEDSGVDAGKTLQPLVAQHGGRGGGSARLAQASVPSSDALNHVLESLLNP